MFWHCNRPAFAILGHDEDLEWLGQKGIPPSTFDCHTQLANHRDAFTRASR
jgi:hypothetical protein